MADALTALISGMDVGVLTGISVLVDRHLLVIVLLLLTFTTWHFRERKRLLFILVTLAFAAVLSFGVKEILAVERPCVQLPSKIECPADPSLPSGHALAAFSLMTSTVGYASFPVYFLFALVTGFSRVYLGIHTFADVAASSGLAFVSSTLAEAILKKIGRKVR